MLVAVADHGNFGKAGLSLNVSQSTVSHSISALEEELGVVLVNRGRHGANLTPVGQQIVEYAKQMMDLSEAIAQTARSARGLNGGVVQIASFRSFATHILPPILATFRERYPNVKVSITELALQGDVESWVRSGKADIGLLHLPVDEGFESWELLRDEYQVFVSPRMSPSSGHLTWETLAQYPLILPPRDDSCSHIIREHFAKYKQPLNVAYEIKESSTAISMVAQGLGIAILAGLVAQPVPPQIQSYSLPAKLERLAGCAVRKNALHSPAVHVFLEALRNQEAFPV